MEHIPSSNFDTLFRRHHNHHEATYFPGFAITTASIYMHPLRNPRDQPPSHTPFSAFSSNASHEAWDDSFQFSTSHVSTDEQTLSIPQTAASDHANDLDAFYRSIWCST